jgi:two-component system, chemotaxis family, sensor kinase CheA
MASIKIDLAALRETFLEEARERIAELEHGLLELEQAPNDLELLNDVFRAAHSLKGGSASVGFRSMARFTHALENLLDPMRNGTIVPSDAIVSLLLRSVDVLAGLLDSVKTGAREPAAFDLVLAELNTCLQHLVLSCGPSAKQCASDPTTTITYEVRFEPSAELFSQGMNPVLLLRNLAEVGTVLRTDIDLGGLPPLKELDPERCYLRWTIWLQSKGGPAEIRDVFAFVEDTSHIAIREIYHDWTDRAATPPEASATAQSEVAEGATPAASETAAPRIPALRSGARRAAHKASTLRVATEKVDKLVDLVGELVIAQSMVAQALSDTSPDAASRALAALAEMDRNTRELQERVLAVRMVPLSTVLNRFPRLVRDLSTHCGKHVRLEMAGHEVEIDKGIVEEIADPLTHLLRNAVDHGIEPTEERRRAGKPETGHIELVAYHQGASVIVEVRDDGRGLDPARIREKGLRLGLIRDTDELTQEQLHALIFAPGFSTAASVTDVSGRGVGLDVVKRNVDALKGSLLVSSQPGAGMCVKLKLPLTLAIMDGLSLRVGQQIFVLPLLPIVESIRPTTEQLKTILGRGEVVCVRDETIPLLRLHDLLEIVPEETDPRRALVVIVESGSNKFGLLVDELLGQAQVVVKSLELNYRKVDAVMGATILGTGRVALILDVEDLARRASSVSRQPGGRTSPERAAPAKENLYVTASPIP